VHGGGSHYTYFLFDDKGNKYKVPQYVFNSLVQGDSFSVTRSLLFNKTIHLQVNPNGGYINENSGVLNSDWFSKIICVIPMLLAVVGIFFKRSLKTGEQQYTDLYMAVLLTVVITCFYFIFST